MSREENETPDLNAVAAALASLAPSTGKLDRDRLMFMAGEAAARSKEAQSKETLAREAQSHSSAGAAPRLLVRRWAWPAAFSTMSAVAASLLAMLLIQPDPQISERIVYLPAEPPTLTNAPRETNVARAEPLPPDDPGAGRQVNDRHPTDDDYLRLRDRVLALGVDSWTADQSATGTAPPSRPSNHRQLFESILQSL
jgi:hypothetical protein